MRNVSTCASIFLNFYMIRRREHQHCCSCRGQIYWLTIVLIWVSFWFIMCDLFSTLTPFMFFDNCVWLGNYALLLWTSVFLLRLALVICSRTNLHTAPESRDSFVWETRNIARLVSGVTLIPDFIQSTRVDGYLRISLFFVLVHKERRAHSST